ncbi:MAG: PQQ-like beta-propeller repeat protein, partial [Alphaproteobacteria bacterium]|nr:PQQ-like beta-propeller repeat protein [Alphaproteobacteria bacterium]
MTKHPVWLGFFGIALLMVACTKDADKLPPKEKRQIALPSQNNVTEDDSLATTPIKLPPPRPQLSWPVLGGGIDRSGGESGGHMALPEKLTRAWQVHLWDQDEAKQFNLYPPVSDGKSVYILDRNAILHRYDLVNGAQIWRTRLIDNPVRLGSESGVRRDSIPTAVTAPATGLDPYDDRLMTNGGLMVAEGKIAAASGENQLVLLNAQNGWEIWRQATSSPLRAPPLIAQDRVFAINSENLLVAYQLELGKKLFDVASIPNAVGYVGGATPATGEGIVVAGYHSGEIYGVVSESGRIAWGESLAMMRHGELAKIFPDIIGRPVIDRGNVYTASRSGQIAAIDMRSGDFLWERNIAAADQPWLVGDFLYVVTKDNDVMCLLRETGKTRWKIRLEAKNPPQSISNFRLTLVGPILAGGRLVVAGSDGNVRF